MSAPLRWRRGTLVPDDSCDLADPILRVADSWLVVEGGAVALAAHRARFLAAVQDALAPAPEAPDAGSPDVEEFWEAVVAAIPRQGVWFPRVELEIVRGAPRLSARIRSAPERRATAVLASWTGTDPRTAPTVKGPDLAAMQRLRTAVQPRGADEAVILRDELVVEGAYSALLWWRDGVLCTPPATLARIPSVTAAMLVSLAASRGTTVREEAATPAALAGTEIWVCSALHGIRRATSWVDGPELGEEPGRRDAWASALAETRMPIAR